MMKKFIYLGLVFLLCIGFARGDTEKADDEVGTVERDIGKSREALRTDDEAVQREEEAINIDKLTHTQKYTFQTEVNRMMKLIINSLYRNKEIFLRELISNGSDALDKIRLLSLTDKNILDTNPELAIRIRADKDKKILSITDSGIGMTKEDLINNIGTIAKSGTAEFLSKMQDVTNQDMNDMIGQFGVGFYSAFLVANKVVVTTKHNDDKQYVWVSDSSSYEIAEDPRGDTLKRGTTVSLYLKDEAMDFLEQDTVMNLVKKYSQFMNYPIYMWASKTIQVEEADDSEVEAKPVEEAEEKDSTEEEEEDANVEEDAEDEGKKKKMIDKTVWDWELVNESKPIWTMKPSEVKDVEYNDFYQSLTKTTQEPLGKIHFVAEGEVTFKALLFIPKVQQSESFSRYGTKSDNIKLYVRRVFISDKINDMMPNYLNFIRGIVDSDDLPLNVSRENLQQHKLIKVIKKKLVRKVLDMIKKLSKEDYQTFWSEYSTNMKLGILEDDQNRARLSKLLQFKSSKSDKPTTLTDYVSRMKSNQKVIYYIAGASEEEVKKSPFVERLNKKGYEVLYLTEPADEHVISSLPLFDGKKFQNVAKEGFSLDDSSKAKEKMEGLKTTFEPLTKWLGDVLTEYINKAQVSERLTDSPCALVASMFGWTGNMERLAISNAHQKADDPQKSYYLNQKKTMEINPRHPLIRELLRRVEADPEDATAKDMASIMLKTATLRSGYMLRETASFASNIEQLMKKALGIPLDEVPEEEDDDDESIENLNLSTENTQEVDADDEEHKEEHDEL